MDSVKYDLKLFLEEASGLELEAFILVFHRWIQEQRLDELLIDVADYRHVPDGPAVLLIAHDAHYAIDMTEGRLGLLYSRRRETHDSRRAIQGVAERLRSVFHCALMACHSLEADPTWQGRLRFRTDELLLRVNDRLVASNTADAYGDLCLHLEPFLAQLYPGCQVDVEHAAATASRLTVVIKATDTADVETLLDRLHMSYA